MYTCRESLVCMRAESEATGGWRGGETEQRQERGRRERERGEELREGDRDRARARTQTQTHENTRAGRADPARLLAACVVRRKR